MGAITCGMRQLHAWRHISTHCAPGASCVSFSLHDWSPLRLLGKLAPCSAFSVCKASFLLLACETSATCSEGPSVRFAPVSSSCLCTLLLILVSDYAGEVVAGLCAFARSAHCIEDDPNGNPGLCSTSWLVPMAANAPMGDEPLPIAAKAPSAGESSPLADEDSPRTFTAVEFDGFAFVVTTRSATGFTAYI